MITRLGVVGHLGYDGLSDVLSFLVREAPAQSAQWNPTDAVRMHSGQIGRAQRWQATAARTAGCR